MELDRTDIVQGLCECTRKKNTADASDVVRKCELQVILFVFNSGIKRAEMLFYKNNAAEWKIRGRQILV